MINIFEYTDYKSFLSDFYEFKKGENSNFSYQTLATKAGFKNKGFVYNIFKGNKGLSKSNIFKLTQALSLNKIETEYFETLVTFQNAESLEERNFHFEKMNTLYAKGIAKEPLRIRQDKFELYSNWHHSVIRSLIDMYPFEGDYKWLSKKVKPSITVKEAKASVALLEKLELVGINKNGKYAVKDKNITTGKSVLSLAVQNFHLECTELAKQAILYTPSTRRNITGLTLGISEKAYHTICAEIQAFQKNIINIANADMNSDKVYQFNFHLFPLSEA
ncbi:MAG: TIGR02147 family protein [Fibrobacterales bacterium]